VKQRQPLIWQFFLSYILVVILSLTAIAWLAIQGFEKFYYHQVGSQLETRAKLVENQIGKIVEQESNEPFIALINSLGQLSKTRYTIIGKSGIVLADSSKDPSSMENHGLRPEVLMAKDNNAGLATRLSYTLQTKMMYVAIKCTDNNKQAFYIRAALPLTKLQQRFENNAQQLVFWGLLITLIAAGISLLISRKIIGPIKDLTDGAAEFAEGKLNKKLALPSAQEIATLAQTLNLMATQLHDRFEIIGRQRQEQEAMLVAMKEGVIAVDIEENILHINSSACDLFEMDANDASGQKFQALIRKPELVQFLHEILKKETSQEAELIFYKSGEKTILTNGTPLHDDHGQVIGALLVLNDMSKQKQLETIRKEFVANVSHELKTPVTLIQGFVETLLDGAMNDKVNAKNFLDRILNNSKRLNFIIEDLLNLSRIEQIDDTTLEMEYVDLKELLEQSIAHCSKSIKEKKMTVELSCQSEVKVSVNQNLLEQAIINLIDNALKYSQTSKPIIVKGIVSDSEICIEVEDFGIGIAADQLERLFERFYRVDKGRSRDAGGTGLGLAIVKHIIQAHKGSVAVKSVLNQGTIFILRLPQSQG